MPPNRSGHDRDLSRWRPAPRDRRRQRYCHAESGRLVRSSHPARENRPPLQSLGCEDIPDPARRKTVDRTRLCAIPRRAAHRATAPGNSRVNCKLVQMVGHPRRNNRLPATDMKEHFRNRSVGPGRGVQDLEGAVIPPSARSAALIRVVPLPRDAPRRTGERRDGQRVQSVEQPAVPRRSACRHRYR